MLVDKKFYIILTAIPRDDHYKELEEGKRYAVTLINMGQSHTSVVLEDFRMSFNSVHFNFFIDEKEVDIYSSPIFNHYMKVPEKTIDSLIKYVD